MLLQLRPLTDWRFGELRLRDGVATALADFSRTSLAGRIGQGVALLFAESKGYRFASHYSRAPGASGPDFVLEAGASTIRALMEAKGAFVRPGERSAIKSVLNNALQQLAVASATGASKSFAVATLLRERGDRSVEPSMIAFVDPEDESPVRSEEPPDSVRRNNYAAWLGAMGLHDASSDLRSRVTDVDRRPQPIVSMSLGGQRFGVSPLLAAFDAWPTTEVPSSGAIVLGLEWSVLEAVVNCLHQSVPLPEFPSFGLDTDDAFVGSMLADGSMLAFITGKEMAAAKVQYLWL